MPTRRKKEESKQNSKDEAIVIVEEEEENNKESKEETPLRDEGIKDELKEETRVIQDLEQGDEDIEEEDNLQD
jgi:hypothetical protein